RAFTRTVAICNCPAIPAVRLHIATEKKNSRSSLRPDKVSTPGRRSPVNPFLRALGIEVPIVQAPMAGVSTPEMAAAVSNAGGLGSIGIGAVDADTARQMIAAVRSRTDRPFNVNVFCHRPAAPDAAREAAWLARLEPEFARYGAKPPGRLTVIYQTFLTDDAKLAVLVAERPAVVSFHFGLPTREKTEVLRAAGIVLLATATNLDEGNA